MATTINSGYGNSPKLTANIADHADVYGGRALVFDGVTDYLTCGTGLGNQLGNGYSKDTGLTASLWFKNDGTTDGGLFQIGNNGGAGEFSFQKDNNNDLYFLLNGNGWHRKVSFTDTSSWHHIVCIYGSSQDNSKIYLDGESVGTAGGSFPSTLDFSGLHTTIGNYWNLAYRFNGKITDVKVFNTELTEAQVTELYLKPENTPNAVQDNLVAWYPMIEGNPESPQSIVYDHSEKKLGSEISGDPTFDNASNWSVSLGNGGVDVNTTVSGKLSVVNAQDTRLYKYSILTVGKLYKVTFVVDSYSSGRVRGLLDNAITFTPTGAGTYTRYFIASNTFFLVSFDGTANMTMTDISIKEVLMGNHATTNFFGDELWDADASSFDSGTHSWVAYGSNTIANDSGALKITYVDESRGAYVWLKDSTDLSTNLTVGKTYKFTFDAKVNSGSSVNVVVEGATASVVVTETSFTSKSITFVATHATNDYVGMLNMSSGEIIFLDNFSLKEVGISSSGFETAVNEPVVPQVPLMRYNQKMFFDGSDGYVQLPAPLSSTNHTISAWYVANSGDNYILDARDGGSDGISLGLLANGTIWYAVRGSGNNSVSSSSGSFNVLNHVVATYNGSTAKIYLNGVEVGSGTFTDTISTTTNARIGRISYGSTGHFDGVVHEVAFYNKDFTQAEAQELFNDGVALDATTHSKVGNLIGYWRNDGVTTWQDRRGWSYLDFDGSSDEVTLDSELTFTGVFSVSFWVKHNSSGTEYVLGKVGGDQDYFYAHPTHPRWRIANNIISSDSDMAVGVWHHVLGVRDSSDNFIWYLNGSLATVYNGSSYVTTGVTRSGDFDVQYFGRSLNTYGEIELTNVAFFNTNKSSSASTFYNNGLSYDYTTESGITNYYKMDSSSTLLDRVGSVNGTVDATLNDGNDGTVSGSPDSITIREGLNANRDGLGFYFKNADSNTLRLNRKLEHLVIPYTKSLSATSMSDAITVECWVKFQDHPSGYNVIASNASGGSWSNGWALAMVDNALRFTINNYNSPKATFTITDFTKWYHIVGIYDRSLSSNNVAIYVDLVRGTSAHYTTPIGESNKGIHIGYLHGESVTVKADTCLIDELRIYNRVLTAFEADGSTPEDGETAISGEIVKNYKHGKGKHTND